MIPDIRITKTTVELNVVKSFDTKEEMLEAVDELNSLREMMAKPECENLEQE